MRTKLYQHSKKAYRMAEKEMTRLYKKHVPTVRRTLKKYMVTAKAEMKNMQNKASPYYKALKKAVTQVRNGVPAQKAFKMIYHQIIFAAKHYQRKAIKVIGDAKKDFCRSDPKLCKMLRQSFNVHSDLFDKYYLRLVDVVATGTAYMHRAIRMASMKCQYKPLLGSSRDVYQVAATLNGNHVLTFDSKYFEMMDNEKSGCRYLLAHDFSNNHFTVTKEGSDIVISTPDMKVTIRANGKTTTVIGKEKIDSLPVESKSGSCVRH